MALRIAHVGAGEWSRFAHGPSLQRLAEQSLVSLEAVCDLDIERARKFGELFQYRFATDSLEEMLAKGRPDAIVLTVNPSATAGLAMRLLPLGIPLFIEKPPGVSLTEAASLARAAVATKTFTFVAFNRRAIPSVVRLKTWGAGRSIRFADARMLRTLRLEPDFAIATGIHVLDTLRHLMGDPISIDVRVRLRKDSSACDYLVLLSFQGSASAEITLMLNTGQRKESYCLSAEGESAEAVLGSAYGSGPDFKGYREWKNEVVTEQCALDDDPLIEGGFIGEYEQFLRSVEKGEASGCSLMDAACSMQLADAVQNRYSGPLPILAFE